MARVANIQLPLSLSGLADPPLPPPFLPSPPCHVFCNGVSSSLRGPSFSLCRVCVCLHACCVCCSVISRTGSPLVAGDWFNIPLGNLCRTNSLQEWKGLEEGRKREAEKCREEEICGEIIIPGVTVATFCEVDVNKILSYTIHFNFTSKRCCRGSGGRWNKAPRAHRHARFCWTHSKAVAGDVCCLQTGWEAHHCL